MEVGFNNNLFLDEGDSIDFKYEAKRFLRYWPWFLITLITALVLAFVYLRYTSRIYQTTAKIKVLDEGEGLEIPTSAFIFKRSNINLENEKCYKQTIIYL